jgi:cell division protein FtsQ
MKIIKRILSLVFISLVIGLSAYGVNHLYKKDSFPIAQIMMVNKLNEQDANQLQHIISSEMNGGFFSLNIELLREEIETLAWIDIVSVRKKWPESVYVDIKEKQVSARWLMSDNSRFTINKLKQQSWNNKNLISDKAIVFSTTLTQEQFEKYKQLALLSVPDHSLKEGLEKCQKIDEKVKHSDLKVLRCFQDQRLSWFVELDNGFQLYLGQQKNRENKEVDNIIKRTELFISAYEEIFKKYEQDIERIDMRYTNGFAIKWKKRKLRHEDHENQKQQVSI